MSTNREVMNCRTCGAANTLVWFLDNTSAFTSEHCVVCGHYKNSRTGDKIMRRHALYKAREDFANTLNDDELEKFALLCSDWDATHHPRPDGIQDIFGTLASQYTLTVRETMVQTLHNIRLEPGFTTAHLVEAVELGNYDVQSGIITNEDGDTVATAEFRADDQPERIVEEP